MKKISTLVLTMAVLSGCATTKLSVIELYKPNKDEKLTFTIEKGTNVNIPSVQLSLMESVIKRGLQDNSLLAAEGNSNHSAKINITEYRMRDDAARLIVGILAGCDKVNSVVTVVNNETGEELGKSNIRINECAAWGVAEQVVTKYANGVVKFLSK